MDNYFISRVGRLTKYIIPEITVLSNSTNRANIIEHKDDNDNPIGADAFRATIKFNPYTYRVSHPIVLDSFVLGSMEQFYEVLEGIYCVSDGTLKLKVKTKYGR